MIFAGSYLPWVGGLAATALALLVAVVRGLGPGIAVGVAGLLSGALTADKGVLVCDSFRLADGVTLPVAGISPNGIPLPSNSPLADARVIPIALALSVVLMTVALRAGSMHMSRKGWPWTGIWSEILPDPGTAVRVCVDLGPLRHPRQS